ncbi:glutamate synthase-related protein [Deltaproteobacteria bacterium]|nr:glutamate synthase-related protein [Deltaproteobacteria bacterium]
MPKKYNIAIKPTPPRFTPTSKSTVLDWEGGCLRCFKCVKSKCVVDAYNQRTFDPALLTDTIDKICKNCLKCVQECPGRVITKALNPEYEKMGDAYWTPDIISTQWYQAETGSIPVSGAGYSGPFCGPGFDQMWTDMSEIVRPTRDGIHGREYINTQVSLGRKLFSLPFTETGEPILDAPKNFDIPIPIIFGELPFGSLSRDVFTAMAEAARTLGTVMEIPMDILDQHLEGYAENIIPILSPDSLESARTWIESAPIIEFHDTAESVAALKEIKKQYPETLVMIKTRLDEACAERAEVLTAEGADIIHLFADRNGDVHSQSQPDKVIGFMKDYVRKAHNHLVDQGNRNSITLIAGGGIAMAEHVPKAIICGADAVSIDIPLLLALECRMCLRCEEGLACPVEIENIHPDWGKNRIMNLIAAWRNQLLEVLGAMGIREVRRLRGEVGRAMFFEDLEADTFGRLFGRRKNEVRANL